jgi:dTDP-4-dehydrorhamnose 3,5-epimerase
LRFNDPSIGIEWPFDPAAMQLSDKDRNAPYLDGVDVFP